MHDVIVVGNGAGSMSVTFSKGILSFPFLVFYIPAPAAGIALSVFGHGQAALKGLPPVNRRLMSKPADLASIQAASMCSWLPFLRGYGTQGVLGEQT